MLYKLCDFGISTEIDLKNQSLTVRSLKTRSFCSPEQMENDPSNMESDEWAIGMIFYLLCSNNEDPFPTKIMITK